MVFVCHPKILHKHCLQFLLGVKMAPRETANNAYAKFWDDKQKVLWCVMVFSGVVNSGAFSFTWYSIMFLSLILIGGLTDRDCFIFRCGPIQDGRHLKPSQDTSRRLVAWMFHQVCSSSIYVSERLWTRLSGNSTRLRVISLSFYLSCDHMAA